MSSVKTGDYVCFDGNKDALRSGLNTDTYELISTKNSSREVKFRLLEIFGI